MSVGRSFRERAERGPAGDPQRQWLGAGAAALSHLAYLRRQPPVGVRCGFQANIAIYTGDNWTINALGAFWIRLISALAYVS